VTKPVKRSVLADNLGPGKGVALYGSINLADLSDKEACMLQELPPGSIMLVSETTAAAMRNVARLEKNDAILWDGQTCWHLASNVRILINPGMFVFKDPETEAWQL
jgi:hypothetical protein